MLSKTQRSGHHRDVTYSMRKQENHFLPMHLLLNAFFTSLQTLWESAQLSSIILTSTSPITSVIDCRAPGCKLYLRPTTAQRRDSRRGPWLIAPAFSLHLRHSITYPAVFYCCALEKTNVTKAKPSATKWSTWPQCRSVHNTPTKNFSGQQGPQNWVHMQRQKRKKKRPKSILFFVFFTGKS